MRKFKKLSAMLGILLTLTMLFNTAVFAEDVPPTGGDGSPTFLGTDEKNDTRLELKERELSRRPRSARATYTVNMTNSTQITSYYCGVASAYMVIRNWGYNVASSSKVLPFFQGCPTNCPYKNWNHTCTSAAKTSPQVTLGTEMSVGLDGASIGPMVDAINNHIGSNYYVYDSIPNTANGRTSLASKIESNLSAGHALIVWVDASKLPRYNSNGSGHYICIYGYNSATQAVMIADCNYQPNYGGYYTVNLATLVNAMSRSSGAANLIW